MECRLLSSIGQWAQSLYIITFLHVSSSNARNTSRTHVTCFWDVIWLPVKHVGLTRSVVHLQIFALMFGPMCNCMHTHVLCSPNAICVANYDGMQSHFSLSVISLSYFCKNVATWSLEMPLPPSLPLTQRIKLRVQRRPGRHGYYALTWIFLSFLTVSFPVRYFQQGNINGGTKLTSYGQGRIASLK